MNTRRPMKPCFDLALPRDAFALIAPAMVLRLRFLRLAALASPFRAVTPKNAQAIAVQNAGKPQIPVTARRLAAQSEWPADRDCRAYSSLIIYR